jgi:hypothetical protein
MNLDILPPLGSLRLFQIKVIHRWLTIRECQESLNHFRRLQFLLGLPVTLEQFR